MSINKKIRAVVTDLDGTLLNHMHTVSDFSCNTIKALADTDVTFMIATGRHHSDARKIREKLGISAYIIAANGATVLSPENEIVHQAEFETDIARAILGTEVPKGVYKNIYQGDHWMVEEIDKVFEDYYTDGAFKYTLVKFEEQLHLPINKVFFTTKDASLLIPIEQKIRSEFGDYADVTFSMPQCLEIMPKGTNKGRALKSTLLKLGIDIQESVAFGDGMNDFEMLSMVGTGYLMENANEMLKISLPNNPRVGHHSEDAVAKKIIDLLELKTKKDNKDTKDPLSIS